MSKRAQIAAMRLRLDQALDAELVSRFATPMAVNAQMVRADADNNVRIWLVRDLWYITTPLMPKTNGQAWDFCRRTDDGFARELRRVMAEKDAWDQRH